MNTNDTNRQKAHSMIDHIFKDLFPAQGMTERSEQIKLSHRMLEHLSEKGLLTAKELAYAKGLAREKYRPQTVWE